MSRKSNKARKINYFRICVSIFITGFLIIGAYIGFSGIVPFAMDKTSRNNRIPFSDTEQQYTSPLDEEELEADLLEGELHSPHSILVRLEDNKVILKNRSEERIYPASLTKIMTAIVALENLSNLEAPIMLPKKIFHDLFSANASMAGFLPGEEVQAIDLLYGTMLPSGADASIGLAIEISGSEKEFVKLMNQKAKKLKMNDTNFTNVSGLHDDMHYTTVKDIAILLEYSLKNETFRQIFTSARHSTASTNRHDGGITFSSTLSKRIDTYEFDGGRILGGKTGYTDEAGLCLASLAEKNGIEYIMVTAGAEGSPYTEQYHILDAFKVYNNHLKR